MSKESTSVNLHNSISTSEAKEILTAAVKQVIADPASANTLPAIMLRGAPGVGKSTIIRSIASQLGIGFVDVRLAQLERVDVCGLPSIEDKTTCWNVPAFWPKDKGSKGIILLDEITSAPPDVQVAAYQLVLDRCISNSNYKVPDGWYIIAAGNRTIDRAVVKTMSSALANRFMHFEVEVNPEEWGLWAVANDIHPSITGFIKFRPGLLFKMDDQNLEQGWPSPRSWERVSNIIPLFDDEELLRKAVYGLVGAGVGMEFMEFYRTNKKMDDVLEMLVNPKAPVVIPTKSDEKCAFSAAASYLLWNGKTEADDKIRVEGLYRILNEMSNDYATLIIKSAMQGNRRISRLEAMKLISGSPSYAKFAETHQKAFSEKYSLDA
jgi:hypothetical protein